jgi:hypothetical protein
MMEKDHDDIVILKEQMRYLTPIIERMDVKLDRIAESHWKLVGKIFGACVVVSVATSFLADYLRH